MWLPSNTTYLSKGEDRLQSSSLTVRWDVMVGNSPASSSPFFKCIKLKSSGPVSEAVFDVMTGWQLKDKKNSIVSEKKQEKTLLKT